MQPDADVYPHDPERPYRTPTTSAGWQTQRFGTPPTQGTQVTSNGNNRTAWALLGIGLLLLLARGVPGLTMGPLVSEVFIVGMLLLTVASCCLSVAFWRRSLRLLIPSCLFAGLSLGFAFVDASNGVSLPWGLASGLVAIWWLGRSWFGARAIWPLFPAVPLVVMGLVIALESMPLFAGLAGVAWWLPLLLIGAGLLLGRGRTAF